MPASLRPESHEYGAYYAGYVALVDEADPLATLAGQSAELRRLLAGVDAGQERHRYAEGKWNIREVVGHMAEVERIFGYRALRIARGDTTPLPGFDQDAYIATAGYDERPLAALLDEFVALRAANVLLFQGLGESDGLRMGTASGYPISVRALLYLLIGHVRHHMTILRDRYLHP